MTTSYERLCTVLGTVAQVADREAKEMYGVSFATIITSVFLERRDLHDIVPDAVRYIEAHRNATAAALETMESIKATAAAYRARGDTKGACTAATEEGGFPWRT